MVLGIDLGTTYSAAAYVDDNGEVQMITNSEGKRLTPSVFFEDTENSIIIGDVAKENAYLRPEDVVSVVKNHMGKKDTFTTSSGKKYVPEEISSYIIRKMVQDAESFAGKNVGEVVITVPAYFNDAQRKATEDAAKIAGVKMLGSINEPTAAMLSYVKKKDIKQGNFMIYDLGGGTFDVSIVKVDGDQINVLSTDGAQRTGGHFFDEAIVKYVCDVMFEKYNLDMEEEKYLDDLQELYIKAEKAKIQLSSRQSVMIPMKVGSVKESIEITREFFDSKVKKLYRNTEAKMKNAIKNAGLKVTDLDTVLMVGGSSRIPFIEERVAEFTGKQPARDINPDEAVAAGAAIYGYMNKNDSNKKVFCDTNSHSIGFLITKADRFTRENHILISKNSPLPATYTQEATMVDDYQTRIDLVITEGEAKEEKAVHIIETLNIEMPKGVRKGDLLEIKYTLDEYQFLHIEVDVPSKAWHYEHKFERKANLSDDEIATMTGIALANTVS